MNKSVLRLFAALFALALFATSCGSEAATVVDEATEAVEDTADAVDDAVTGDDEEEAMEEEAMEEEAAEEEAMEEEAMEEEPADDDDDVVLTQGGSVLDDVKARGELNCGVSGAAIAFSVPDPSGRMVGFDADMCRAVAAAILGDAEAVNLVALTAAERFTAVQTGDVDVLMRNTTWTQSRDTDLGMDFGPTTYYDGQQLMGRAGDGFTGDSTVADIDGAVVCTNAGTTTEKNINDAAAAAGVSITLNTFEDFDQVTDNFISGACDIVTTDGSGLVGRKAEQQPADQDWAIFPATPISKEPLGPTYGQNDSAFADAVNWTMYAMIIADEKGITSSNAGSIVGNDDFDAEAQRLMGGEGELQTLMGLDADAFVNVIEQIGNYDELFSEHFDPVGIKRAGSANAGWQDGGLIYAPPAR